MNYPLFNFLAAAAEPIVRAVENGVNAAAGVGFWQVWGPGFLGPIVVAGLSWLGIWYRGRSKNKIDQEKLRVEQFSTFMNESQEFREETRKEREVLKIELLALQAEKRILVEKITICEQSSKDCAEEVRKYKSQLEVANKEIETLTLKINGLKERMVIAETDANSNGKI